MQRPTILSCENDEHSAVCIRAEQQTFDWWGGCEFIGGMWTQGPGGRDDHPEKKPTRHCVGTPQQPGPEDEGETTGRDAHRATRLR